MAVQLLQVLAPVLLAQRGRSVRSSRRINDVMSLTEELRREGDLADDGYGPPVPFGSSNLTEGQTRTALALARNDPDEAITYTRNQNARNEQKRQFDEQLDYSYESLDEQRRRQDFTEQKYEDEQNRLNELDAASDADLAAANAAFADPALAALRHVEKGRDVDKPYAFADPDRPGGVLTAYLPQTKEHTARAGVWDRALTGREIVQEMIGEVLAWDPTTSSADALAAKLSAMQTRALFAMKDQTKGGALDQGLIDTTSTLVPDPSSLASVLASDPSAVVARLLQADAEFAAGGNRAESSVRHWQGMDELRERAGQARARGEMLTGAVNQLIQSARTQRQTEPGTYLSRPLIPGFRFPRIEGGIRMRQELRDAGASPQEVDAAEARIDEALAEQPVMSGPIPEAIMRFLNQTVLPQ